MGKISFVYHGHEHGQERSGNRIANKSDGKQYVQHYEQPKSGAFKSEIKMLCIMEQNKTGGVKPLEGPVVLNVTVYRTIPKSWSNKKKAAAAAGRILPATKPDLKNIIWGIEDALNGLAYKDDGQVCSFGRSCKRYTDGPPRIVIEVATIAWVSVLGSIEIDDQSVYM